MLDAFWAPMALRKLHRWENHNSGNPVGLRFAQFGIHFGLPSRPKGKYKTKTKSVRNKKRPIERLVYSMKKIPRIATPLSDFFGCSHLLIAACNVLWCLPRNRWIASLVGPWLWRWQTE